MSNKDSLLSIEGLLIFNIDGKEYCSDISDISVVLKLNKENLQCFQHEKGILVFQNRKYKIIDIHEMLKAGYNKVTSNSKIILFSAYNAHFGFIANRVVEIITIDSDFIEDFIEFVPSTNDGFISGELIIQSRKILFLDFKRFNKDLKNFNTLKVTDLPEEEIETT